MDMPGAARIEARLHCSEEVLAARSGLKPPVSLKIGVAVGDRTGAVDVGAIVIGLPDLEHGAAHGLAVLVEHTAAHPGDRANRRRNRIVDQEEVIVAIERQVVRIVWSERLVRRLDERLSECPSRGEEQSAEPYGLEELAAVLA